MSKIICTVTALLFIGAVAFAQAPDQKPCAVDGSVVNSATGAPIARAHVNAAGADDNVVVESDDAGNWKAPQIACGSVSITVRRVGFLSKERTVPAPAIILTADNPVHGVKLELAPQGVIAGRVLDDQGDPIQSVQVSLMTSRIINGLRGIQASTSAMTDDLGEYRFAGLTAGKYIVCANAGGGVVGNGGVPYDERCYPGPPSAGPASAMDIAAGYEGRVDFTLSPLSAVRVSGVVSGQMEGANNTVGLTPQTQIARMFMGLSSKIRPDGTFFIRGVPPGSYTLIAISSLANKRLEAHVPLDVGTGNIEGVQVHLEPGVTVTGTIQIISGTGRKFDERPLVFLKSAEYEANTVNWDESGTSFTMRDVIPGSYRLSFGARAPFYLKSATVAGRDIADSEVAIGPGGANIEVVLSDDGGAVEGDVSADDVPAAGWIVIEKDGAPSRNTRTDAKGHFKIDALPPADYMVYAWDDNANVEYANPEWMQHNGKGVAVSVAPGQTAQVKLVRQLAPTE